MAKGEDSIEQELLKQLQRIQNYKEITKETKEFIVDGKRYSSLFDRESISTYKPISDELAASFAEVVIEAREGKVEAKTLEAWIEELQRSFEIVEVE